MDDIPDLVTGDEPDFEQRLEEARFVDPGLTKEQVQKYQDTLKLRLDQPTGPSKRIPVTIITGYLGSGKSTLLQHLATEGKRKFAVILNEFGDSSEIEKSLTMTDGEKSYTEWLDLGNGCLCCTVKDAGVQAIEDLVERSGDSIDYILLETTGIADPAPIARMFWLDEGIKSNVYIDGVVTVLDAGNIEQCLKDVGGHWHEEHGHGEIQEDGVTTAHLQIALADVVLLNKIDTLRTDKDKIIDIVAQINNTAPVFETKFGDIDVSKILDLHAFESNIKLGEDKGSFHDSRISTITFNFGQITEEQFKEFENFIQYILWENTANGKDIEVHRAKGIVLGDEKIRVLQGVREAYEFIDVPQTEAKTSKLVLIGKNLELIEIITELEKQTSIRV